jgi:hypothetical protein
MKSDIVLIKEIHFSRSVVQTTSQKVSLIREMARDMSYIDPNLPRWARRSHPVVKRYLGTHWRVIPPQAEPVMQWYIIQAVTVIATIPFPFLFTIIIPLVLVSLAVLPIALFYYGRALFEIAAESAKTMSSEVENSTLQLLLATPMNVREVLLSKISGVVWMQSEMLSLILVVAGLTQLPTLMMLYIHRYPLETVGVTAHVFMLLALASSVVRIPIEMFAVAMVGQVVGLKTRGRNTAAASAASLVAFYFILINMPRLLHVSLPFMLIVEIIMPVVLPLVIILMGLRLIEREIERQ